MKYKIYILDFEVFAYDWLVVISDTEGKDVKVIHNNPSELALFVAQPNIIVGGYNNKHYDDWIMMTILSGGNNEQVKACNDWIIREGKNGWEYPLINKKKKSFVSFDLMDDIGNPMSLKAIEANIGASIVESDVDFNIDHPLTLKELAETIHYCKSDVANTVKLYHLRKSYLEGKIAVGKLKGWDEKVSLPPTNPKLTALFLGARLHDYDDEFEYTPPDNLQLGKYQQVLDFYKNIDYSQSLELEVAGLKHKYGWGGIHASVEHYQDESTDQWKIVDIDVGSMYPTIMLNWSAISRSIPSAEGYAAVYHRRLDAKHSGRKEEANALKLVLNSTYGAMKNGLREQDAEGKRTGKILFGNPLYDPHMANRVCITGQLWLTDILEKLEKIKSFKLIQSNTDGLMIKYHIRDEKKIQAIVKDWETRSRMTMEWKLIKKIACMKDVNNYILVEGETWIVKDGEKTITDPDKNKITTKGGWVSQWDGGDWKNNSLSIVHKALVNYFVDGTPPEETINNETDIFKFQIVCKTGRTYDSTVWKCNGADVPVQRVNRVYASSYEGYGMLYKMKGTSPTKMPDLPEHCIVDNGNQCVIEQINRKYYIDLAWKRIKDYLGVQEENKKTKRKKVEKMAVKATEEKLNLLQKLIKIRKEFLEADVKKSGINRYLGYDYFELKDIVPVASKLFDKYGVYHEFQILNDMVHLLIYNADNLEEAPREFCLPLVNNEASKGQTPIQILGGEITYYRRYLYLIALDIVEAELFDAVQDGKDEKPEEAKPTKTKKSKAPASKEERKEAVEEMTSGKMDDVDLEAIQNGLKQLRASDVNKNGEQEKFIAEVWAKAKAKAYSKEDVEDVLIKIGGLVG